MENNCPVCGTPCSIEGNTTKHYQPISAQERLVPLEEKELAILAIQHHKPLDKGQKSCVDIMPFIKAICSRFGGKQ